MKFLLRHSFNQFVSIEQKSAYQYEQISRLMVKNLLFHHIEDVDNYIRLHVKAATLVKLEIEYLTVE